MCNSHFTGIMKKLFAGSLALALGAYTASLTGCKDNVQPHSPRINGPRVVLSAPPSYAPTAPSQTISSQEYMNLKSENTGLKAENESLLAANKNLTEKLHTYESQLSALNVAEAQRIKEGRLIHSLMHQISLPSFPLARTTITKDRKKVGPIQVLSYQHTGGYDLIDTQEKLQNLAFSISLLYNPSEANPRAFELLASYSQVPADFVQQLEKNQSTATKLDLLAQFSAAYSSQNNATNRAFPHQSIRFTDAQGATSVIAPLDKIVQLTTRRTK